MDRIDYLPWDSDFFKLRIGRKVIEDEGSFNYVQFNEEAMSSYDLVYLISPDRLLSYNTEYPGRLNLEDIMMTLSMPLDSSKYLDVDHDFISSLTEKEISECYLIAEQVSEVSRFYKESIVGPAMARALYRKWIDTALDKSFSDGLFLVKESDNIQGIHLIRTDIKAKTGYFTLTGIKSGLRGMGLGRELWNQSLGYWSKNTNIETIRSPFSLGNQGSFNFHLKYGFNRVEEISYIYHWKNQKA